MSHADTLTSTEQQLAAIWSDVLELPEILPEQTFFELGGDSIAAMLCINRLRDSLSVELPVRLLLDEHMTLRSFAEAVTAAHASLP